jgi:hypothetical protein
MMWPDLANGLLEFSGGMFLWRNVIVIMRQKSVRGVSVMTTAFFAAWGFWNLFYYPHLNQWFSFIGGCNIVIPNTLWVILAIKYSGRDQ